MNRTQRLKAKLFEMDDRALFLERMEIIEIGARYRLQRVFRSPIREGAERHNRADGA